MPLVQASSAVVPMQASSAGQASSAAQAGSAGQASSAAAPMQASSAAASGGEKRESPFRGRGAAANPVVDARPAKQQRSLATEARVARRDAPRAAAVVYKDEGVYAAGGGDSGEAGVSRVPGCSDHGC